MKQFLVLSEDMKSNVPTSGSLDETRVISTFQRVSAEIFNNSSFYLWATERTANMYKTAVFKARL